LLSAMKITLQPNRRPGTCTTAGWPTGAKLHPRDQRTCVAFRVACIEQHALKALREQRRGERRQELGVERLLKVGANEADHVRAGVDQALRQAIDAIAEMIGGAQDPLAGIGDALACNARGRRHFRCPSAMSPAALPRPTRRCDRAV
jgi:hypothetical protein